MIRQVAFPKALAAGALGAVAWEFGFRLIHFAIPMDLDLVANLGKLILPQSDPWQWWTAGMMAHLCVGSIWAIFYAYFFWSSFPFRPALQGMLFSLIPAFAGSLSLVPQMEFLDPQVALGFKPALGFFALRVGWDGPVILFSCHLIYGVVMGSIYQHPAGYPIRLERGPLKWKAPQRKNQFTTEFPDSLSPTQDQFMFCTGIECSYPTLNQGKWRMDELELTGHYQNWERDLDLVSELGIRFLRYGPPLHWIFKGPGRYDWGFLDAVFNRMRELDIVPIVDLCHFGLPAWMGNFQNPEFPDFLAEYAGAMARRYPWIRYWNPVNEIYVVSRESALHGSWNEQERSEKAFVRATCNMVKASHQVMREILKTRKDAIFFTSESSEYYQACCPDPKITQIADFENQRRFLASDLMLSVPVCDEIKNFLLSNGMKESEYELFMSANLSSKIIMGLDYYPWNEKLINSKGEAESLGELFGWFVITKQYYERYHRPLFHSETNFQDADQGPNWLWRQWHNLQMMRKEGVPVVGFTWYSLQDQIDWDIGISQSFGNVNPVGLYDLNRDPRPVRTAYQQLLRMFKNEKIRSSVFEEMNP